MTDRLLTISAITFSALLAGSALSAEHLTIQQLQRYGSGNHLHSVSIIGTVQAIEVLPPVTISQKCLRLYGRATFLLTDETGTIPVDVPGSCFAGADQALPKTSDLIRLTAMIQVFRPDGHKDQILRAVAQEIVILDPQERALGLPVEMAILPMQEYAIPAGSHPHDVAPAPDGSVWYVGQASGELGRLDPETGRVHRIKLGDQSRPHGVIVGPDGAPWITDGGLNAIVRVDPRTETVKVFPLPPGREGANLNTATFDRSGRLWFTGQSGVYGRLNPTDAKLEVFDAPKGAGAYGIATAPDGTVYFVSLAGSYLGRIDSETGKVTVIEPPTPKAGTRRVWADSKGNLWVSEWNVGKVARYSPSDRTWREWPLPGSKPGAYAVYVDEKDKVWLTDFGANALVRFDPEQERFHTFPIPSPNAQVRQLLGRAYEVWGAESGTDKLVVVRTLQKP
jgi:virginiamycin B lyase